MKNLKPFLSITIAIFFLAIPSFAELRSNGKIAFTSDRDGNPEIYVMNSDGTGQMRITTNSGRDDCPTWSPDGEKIAFIRQNGLSWSIILMDANGNNQTQVVSFTGSGVQLFPFARFGMAWSPDGTKIVFQDTRDILVIDASGNGIVNLTNGQFLNFEPSWSPDGSKIAFARSIYSHGYYPDVFTMNAQGGDVRQITGSLPYSESTSPDWSPDGSQLTLLSGADAIDNSSLATITLTGFLQFPLIYNDFGDYIYTPRWSPDGTKIVFAASGISSSFSEIWTIDPSTRALTQLTSGFTNDYRPDWQPLRPSVSVSGRVATPSGMGLRNAVVVLTDQLGVRRTVTTSSFGLYGFQDVQPGMTYIVSVASKRYRFQTRSVTSNENVTGFDFIGLE